MQYKKLLILALLFLPILSISVQGQEANVLNIEIDMRDFFSMNEKISFNYTIISTIDQEIKYLPYVECPNALVSFLTQKTTYLIANQPLIEIYNDFSVDENIEPQTCTAYIQILSPIQKTVSKNFSIITDPSFSFNIKLDKKIFLLGEDIYLDYTSDVENPSITSTLTYPDGTTESITLPASIKAEQIGTYELDVTASKEGYKTITKKEQFGVIKEQANIKTVLSSNLIEDEDRVSSFDIEGRDRYLVYILIGVLLVVIIVLVVFLAIRRKKESENTI